MNTYFAWGLGDFLAPLWIKGVPELHPSPSFSLLLLLARSLSFSFLPLSFRSYLLWLFTIFISLQQSQSAFHSDLPSPRPQTGTHHSLSAQGFLTVSQQRFYICYISRFGFWRYEGFLVILMFGFPVVSKVFIWLSLIFYINVLFYLHRIANSRILE